jgi:hypothetical protein
MNMRTILLASTALFALSAPAFAVDKETYETTTKIEKDSAGNYNEKETVTKTDADKTTTSTEKSLIVEVDSNGNIDKSKTVEITSDPKGLGNKHVVMIKDTEKTKDGKVISSHEKTVDGKNVEGTTDKYKSTSEVKRDSKGNYAERDITTKTDSNGTITSFEKDAKVDVDVNGDTNKSTTTKKVTDPKGLMNKDTVKTSATEKVKDGVIRTSEEVKVNGQTISSEITSAPSR